MPQQWQDLLLKVRSKNLNKLKGYEEMAPYVEHILQNKSQKMISHQMV